MKIKLKKIKVGEIFMPRVQIPHIRCGKCETTIIKESLPDGKLTIDLGLPICSRCKIIKTSKFSDEMQHTDEYKKDQEVLGEVLQKQANERAIDVAIASQQQTQTTISI